MSMTAFSFNQSLATFGGSIGRNYCRAASAGSGGDFCGTGFGIPPVWPKAIQLCGMIFTDQPVGDIEELIALQGNLVDMTMALAKSDFEEVRRLLKMPVIGGAPWLRKGKMATQIHKTINATIAPANPLHGVVQVPGDKSISHRLAMLASLAQGRSVIRNYLRSEDCLNTLRAVAALGADVSWRGDVLYVTGQGWRVPTTPLDLGNSGTSLRLLAGLLAGRPWATVMTGDESLCRRPMERIRHPLSRWARLEFFGALLRAIDSTWW